MGWQKEQMNEDGGLKAARPGLWKLSPLAVEAGSQPHLSPRIQASVSHEHYQEPGLGQSTQEVQPAFKRRPAGQSLVPRPRGVGKPFAAVYEMCIGWINKLHFPGLPISKHAGIYIRSET